MSARGDNAMAELLISVSLAGPELPDELANDVALGLEESVGRLLHTLGIPGAIHATVIRTVDSGAPPLAFTFAGSRCVLPDETTHLLDMYVRGEHDLREETSVALVERLVSEAAAAKSGDLLWRRLVDFVARAGEAAVSQQPSVCFGADAFFVWSRKGLAPLESPSWVAEVLRETLDLGVSIADDAAVAMALHAAGEPREAVAEALLDALAPDALRLRIDPRLFRRATTRGNVRNARDAAADDVFDRVGLPLPPVRFDPDPAMLRDTFAVGVNHLPAVPRLGLPESQVMVLEDVARMWDLIPEDRSGAVVRTRFPGITEFVVLADEGAAAAHPLAAVDVWEHILLSLVSEVRANSWRLVTRRVVSARLDVLRSWAPSLVEAVEQQIGTVRLTRVLRLLVADQVPIGDLGRICDQLLLGRAGLLPTDVDEREAAAAVLADLVRA